MSRVLCINRLFKQTEEEKIEGNTRETIQPAFFASFWFYQTDNWHGIGS